MKTTVKAGVTYHHYTIRDGFDLLDEWIAQGRLDEREAERMGEILEQLDYQGKKRSTERR